MSFFHVYVFLHILLMLGIIALCAGAGMPTRYWLALGSRIRQRFLQNKGKKLKKALRLQGIDFPLDESFLDCGVGLAIDHQRGLIFLAQPEKDKYETAVLSKAQLGTHTVFINQVDGFQRCYLDISQIGDCEKKWRLPCADADLATEINDALGQFINLGFA